MLELRDGSTLSKVLEGISPVTQHFSHQEESDFLDANAYCQDDCPHGDECELMHFSITEEYPQLTLKEEIKYENYLHPHRRFKIYDFLQ